MTRGLDWPRVWRVSRAHHPADVTPPVMDGFEVLRQIRKRSDVPVIMLTAARRSRTDHRPNAGADDDLPKPFDPDELLPASARASPRRNTGQWRPRPTPAA